jgi:REP element-mobilizing transposase RayT
MTYARSILVPPGSPGTYHCVSRCVRRAWLCGEDRESGRSYEHRRQWVEDRIGELAEIFAVAVWGYAVMSNHLHVVVEVRPQLAAGWSAEEVATRWCRLYPRQYQDAKSRSEVLAGNAERIDVLRARLGDLSWFMRRLAEPIARRANREDGCKGHFWEARFKCQTLLDETSVLSAMAYVDLNPIRAGICDNLDDSLHTSARARLDAIEKSPDRAEQPLAPVLGIRGARVVAISERNYLDLVDHTGRQIHPGKRGTITGPPPAVLARLGHSANRWRRQVLATNAGYVRVIGSADMLSEKAIEIEQKWLRGIGLARLLEREATRLT